MTTTKSDIGRYGITPEWLLDSGISDRAVRLFATIAAKYADRDTDKSFPSRTTLAAKLNCSTDSIDRAIKELVEVGALVVERRKVGKVWLTSVYLLVYTRPPSRTDTTTHSRAYAEENQNQGNQNHEPDTSSSSEDSEEVKSTEIWPESYSLFYGLEGAKETVENYCAWLTAKDIPESFALQKVYALREWWPTRPKKREDPWLTFTNWVTRDWKKGGEQNGITQANIPTNYDQADDVNSRAAREQRIAAQRARAAQMPEV